MSLANKYRPKSFSEVIGQKHIIIVLKNILLRARQDESAVPNGLCFVGSRGTGKTTVARIVAAALNCDSQMGDACGQCVSCVSISTGRHPSVHELDAASAGLVDDVRKVREQAQYAHEGLYRIFIFDEAHSMTREAFNALLKQLEEPPLRVLFILCTTEPHRIPETVISRMMMFEFRRLHVRDIAHRLALIAKNEEISASAGALVAIASQAEGGVRDAIMALEQLSSYADVVSEETVAAFFGAVDSKVFSEFIRAALSGDFVKGNQVVYSFFSVATEPAVFVDGLLKYCTNALLYRQRAIDNFTDPSLASQMSESLVMAWLGLLWEMRSRFRYTEANPQASLLFLFGNFARAAGKIRSAVGVAPQSQDRITDTERLKEGLFGTE